MRPHGLCPARLLTLGFSRQEYWSVLPCPSREDLPSTGIEPRSPVLQADCLPIELKGKPQYIYNSSRQSEAVLCLVAQLSLILCNPMDCSPPGSSVHGDSPGKNTGVGCHALCQGIFPTQGSSPGLLHCRWILYHLSHQESPRILKQVAYPFPKGSSQSKN